MASATGERREWKSSLKVFRHHLEFMSTIFLNAGKHSRNWPRIDFQPLKFNFEFYFEDFGWLRFAEFKQRVKIVGLYIKFTTSSRSQKIIQNNYFD